MTTGENAPARSDEGRLSAREMLAVAIGLAALYALMLLLSDGKILFTRPLWVDEVWTLLVSGQDSPADVIGALAAGADGGSGLFHLNVWAFQKIFGTPSPTLLRGMSLVCVAGMLCVVYATLRRRFGRDASIAGMLAVGTHYQVVSHAFEGRFYGPWLLSCALLAMALSGYQESQSRRNALLVALAAMFQTLIHFYGVFTLAAMIAGVAVAHGRRWRDGLRVVAPAAAGFVAFLALTPLVLAMRSSLAVPTWLPDFQPRQLRLIVQQFWFGIVPLATAAALVVGIIMRARKPAGRPLPAIARHAFDDAGIVSLAGLAAIPLILTAVTLASQPSMLPRYHMATLLAWAPFVALTMEFLGAWPARLARIVLIGFWFASFVRVTFEKEIFAGDVEEAELVARRSSEYHVPVVFQSVQAWYPVWARDTARAESIGMLDMSDETLARMFRPGTQNEVYNRVHVLEKGIARVHASRFGIPRLVAEEVLDTTPRFILVAAFAHLPKGFPSLQRFAATVFPDHRVTMLDFSAGLLELTPDTARPASQPRPR